LVLVRRSADRHCIERGGIEHRLGVAEHRQTLLRTGGTGCFARVAGRDHTGALNRFSSINVRRADPAQADYPDLEMF
jgi:hypothetical protein